MPTRDVVITERQARFIEALVQSGRYQNASEVMLEGLRIIERLESDDDAKCTALRAAADLGVEALERGAFKEFSDAAGLVEHLDEIAVRVRASSSGD